MDQNTLNKIAALFRRRSKPQSYKRFMAHWGIDSLESYEYWDILPDYIIARCPICGETYTQALDLYSLYLWTIFHNHNSVIYARHGYKKCEHFVGVHTFLNLNGHCPNKSELDTGEIFSSEPEVPMVSPHLFHDDMESYAVIHALPICQPWGNYFRPLYTLFMLTYYATDKRALEIRRLLEWTGEGDATHLLDRGNPWAGSKRLMLYWEEASDKIEAWDLLYWVNKGKLRWLDLNVPHLPLNNQDEKFPYIGIEGKRTGYKYNDKKFEIVHTHPTMDEFRKNLAKYG